MQWIRIIISSGRIIGDHRVATFRPSKQWTSNENRGWRVRYLLPFMLLHPLFETPSARPECFAQPPSERASRDEPTRTLLKKTVVELRSSGGEPWGGAIPGITATLITAAGPEAGVVTVTSGFADIAAEKRLNAESGFHIGSITKTFTAALILQLSQEGKLSLQDPMSRWIDGFAYGKDVTVEMLLRHTSGIPDFVSLPAHDPADSPRESIRHVLNREPDFQAGTRWKYSNTNYTILGLIAEEVTSSTWEDLITRRFFKPLKLDHTYVWTGTPRTSTVTGYEPSCNYFENPACARKEGFRLNRVEAEKADWKVAWAAGAIVSTSADVAKWITALMSGKVLDEHHLTMMMTASSHSIETLSRGKPYGELEWIGYGLGLCQFRIAGDRIGWGHSGAIHGGVGNVIYMLDNGDAFSLLSNYGKFDVRSSLGSLVIAY